MKKAILLLALISSIHAMGQDMLKAAQREQTMLRYGVGFQLMEPTAVSFQVFHGFFCSNSDSFATFGVLEVNAGIENLLGLMKSKTYADGVWRSGGVRAEMNYLYPFITLEGPVVFQAYLGAGIQTGSRKYDNINGSQSAFATGANGLLRFELVTNGFESGRGLWFMSIFADLKYHKDFTQDFSYFTPGIGIRFRKGRGI